MRKFLFLILICLSTIRTNAITLIETQNIKGLDEVSIQGTWIVYESTQPSTENVLTDLTLVGDSSSTMGMSTVYHGQQTKYLKYYFISSCQTDNYVLHLEGNPLQASNSWTDHYKYVIKQFDGDTMELTNFSETYTIKLIKENAYSAPINADDKEADDRIFNLNGQEIVTPQGIYIQNGEKKIAK